MHIIFVTSELAGINEASYGLATFTANIARIFRDKGHYVEIILVTTKETNIIFYEDIIVHKFYIPLDEWMEYDYIAHLYTKEEDKAAELRRNMMNIQKAKMVKDKIYQINSIHKIDIVHFSNHGSFSLFMDTKIPFVTRISGFLNILFGGADQIGGSLDYKDNMLSERDMIEIHTMKKSPFIIAPSKLLANIGRNYATVNPVVIESPFVLSRGNYDYGIYNTCLKDKKYILFYGRFRYYKGIHVIAHMAKSFLQKYKDRFLVMVGNTYILSDDTDGEELDAVAYVKKHAEVCADRVICMGPLVREQLYPIIEYAECCVLPSRIENLANSCIEAMAMGKIVIATNGASYEQLINDGENGYLCERDNAEDFLRGVEKVLSLSKEENTVMSQNAIKTVERLRPDNIYGQYLEYYQQVIREWK